jgi:hypothetical protein
VVDPNKTLNLRRTLKMIIEIMTVKGMTFSVSKRIVHGKKCIDGFYMTGGEFGKHGTTCNDPFKITKEDIKRAFSHFEGYLQNNGVPCAITQLAAYFNI